MQPTLDPKTSQSDLNSDPIQPSEDVPFMERFYVAGNASFLCLAVAVAWTFLVNIKPQISMVALFSIAPPLVATGATVMLAGAIRDIVPKPRLTPPLPVTIPLIWCLLCYLTVQLMATQETGTSQIPDALLPVLVWVRPATIVPVCLAQMLVLAVVAFLNRNTVEA